MTKDSKSSIVDTAIEFFMIYNVRPIITIVCIVEGN